VRKRFPTSGSASMTHICLSARAINRSHFCSFRRLSPSSLRFEDFRGGKKEWHVVAISDVSRDDDEMKLENP